MKTISNIQLKDQNNQFRAVKTGLKVSVLLVASFMVLNALGIPFVL